MNGFSNYPIKRAHRAKENLDSVIHKIIRENFFIFNSLGAFADVFYKSYLPIIFHRDDSGSIPVNGYDLKILSEDLKLPSEEDFLKIIDIENCSEKQFIDYFLIYLLHIAEIALSIPISIDLSYLNGEILYEQFKKRAPHYLNAVKYLISTDVYTILYFTDRVGEFDDLKSMGKLFKELEIERILR